MLLLFALTVIATWYLTQAVTLTKGPFNIFKLAREKLPHGGLLECHVCFGLWAALFFTWIASPNAPINQIVFDGVAAAGVFVILWDGSIFIKSVIEGWLFALQLAAQPHANEIAQLSANDEAFANELEKMQKQIGEQQRLIRSLLEDQKNAQQHATPFSTVFQSNGNGPLEGSADQQRE